MKYTAIPVLALVSLALLIAGCTGPEHPGPPAGQDTPVPPVATTPSPVSGSGESVVAANNRFALDLYARLADEEDGNIFFSPFSISSALAITWEGARGNTADEIRAVFHFPDDPAVMREEFAATMAGINSGSSAYTLRTANALWAEQTYPFLPEYISTAGRYYSADTTNLDFITKPEESRVTINTWVEEQTGEKIKDILPEGSIDPLTRLVITNAIYFKGTWVKQFDEEKTTEETFRTGTGTIIRVPMMQRTDKDAVYGYAETDVLQVLSMPYESDSGKELSMLVLLPKGDDLTAVGLDAESLSDLQQNLTSRRVMVYFPKFTLETKYSLPPTLSVMGMPTAFTGAADFSGMDGTRNLFIDDVIHQAFVEVNEEGTEAAAATAGIIKLSSMPVEEPVPVFRADHPFIFLIQDDETGNILFMGRVTNPVGS